MTTMSMSKTQPPTVQMSISSPPPAYFAQTMQPFPCFDYPYTDDQESENDSEHDSQRDFNSDKDSSSTCVNSTHAHTNSIAHSDVTAADVAITVPIPIGMYDSSDPSSEKFCAEFEVRVDVSTAVYRASGKGECDEEVWLTGTGANGRGIPIVECP